MLFQFYYYYQVILNKTVIFEMQRHVTSVFSDYEAMDNNSANSKQLQYWLKQIANPSSANSPNLGFEWTFMSHHSSHKERIIGMDQISFGKTVHSSIQKDKQNNSMVSNGNNNVLNNVSLSESKNKSYVNAMIALQKKVKTLEDQNHFMRKNLVKANEQRSRSMSQSFATEQQLKARLKIIQPKVQKIQQLIQQNKMLRESRDQKNRKLKTMQKSFQQLKTKYQQLIQQYDKQKRQLAQSRQQLEENDKKVQQVQQQLKKLLQKNRALQDMKQKSTVSIMQKYKKSLQLVQSLQKQNMRLKNELQSTKTKHNQQIKNIQESHNNQIKKCQIQFEKLKQNINMKQSLIQQKKKQAEYFRDAYEKKDQQFLELVKSQHKIIQEQKQKEKQKFKLRQKQILEENQRLLQKSKKQYEVKQAKLNQEIEKQQKKLKSNQNNYVIFRSNESSRVQIPQTLIPGNKKSFQGFQSEQQEEQLDQSIIPNIPAGIQTKSVGKPTVTKRKKNERKSVLSSQSRKKQSRHQKNQQKSIISHLGSPKDHRIIKKKKNQKQEASFTMKSCQAPKTQPIHKIIFEGGYNSDYQEEKQNKIINSYYYTTQYPPIPYPAPGQQNIQEFKYKNNIDNQTIDQALLIQLQKQLLTLYNQQENLLLASHDQYATQAQRSQYVGRIRQINEQLRIKNQKMCELKAKL